MKEPWNYRSSIQWAIKEPKNYEIRTMKTPFRADHIIMWIHVLLAVSKIEDVRLGIMLSGAFEN